MPDTLAPAFTADALIRHHRRPALTGFIARKVIAADAATDRAKLIAACKAEQDWAHADYTRIAAELGLGGLNAERGTAAPMWEATRLPHERAAATVLNAWGHLHPTERRIRECAARLLEQRKAGPAWAKRAAGTAGDIRAYWHDRAKASRGLVAAIAEYRRLRAAVDVKEAA